MFATAFGSAAATALFAGAMVHGGLNDLRTMRISNRLVLVLIAAYFVFAPLRGLTLETVGSDMLTGGVVLVAGLFLFSRGWVGGGDAKLAAATALWLGGALMPLYLVLLSAFGGLLTLAVILFRAVELSPAWREQDWLARLHDKKSGVPYGVALAAAGLFTFAQSLA